MGQKSAQRAARKATGSSGSKSETPHPLERQKLKVAELEKRRAYVRARRQGFSGKTLLAAVQYLLAKAQARRVMRVWMLYSMRHGPLMAAGSAYNMFFSVAAMLVAGFSIFGLIASGNRDLQQAVVEVVIDSTPGLIGEGGLATPEQLFSQGGAFGVSLIISTAAMVLTSLGWIAGLREGMRGVFGLTRLPGNPVLIKLKDIGTLLLLGVALMLTSAVAGIANTALDLIIDLLHFDGGAVVPLTKITAVLVMLLLDMAAAVVLFRIASGIRMPRSIMFQAALIAGLGSTVLRYFASDLLGTVGNNPLLAPFAVILGLFVWFYFLSQIYLIATAWGAIGKADLHAREQAGGRTRGFLSLRRRARLKQDGSLDPALGGASLP
ncbi:YihY/virulence factor BrkB family protein [Arthrobacter sp. VKM Ac-2550]|uniref:YihY/virulence factor BrkB family protein n=1 Tax=Crystallibacter permensis TaxID=1938888 RepID=UPI002226B811|nr:YihY/virulence factor BrkB family protein [Arthrobacter sp. VKM Ac-2550]MCW2132526.1 membrane protein [Arthrobacter sp. VKM Ac-2550]